MREAAFVLALFVAACATPAGGPAPRAREIAGAVSWQQEAGVPAGSEIHVQLIDGSQPGSLVVAETRFAAPGEAPAPFSVSYDPSSIRRDGHYYLRATVLDSSGAVRLLTPEDVPVIVGSLTAVELVVEPPRP
jgi:uncharacterized lipoprotein YbaY